jgi:hemerythrin-like domain-containing protein
MQATASRAREYQVVYCGLEVLRLIGERIETAGEVDPEDLLAVLAFMSEVAHRCLDNTEEILRFASMDHQLASHRHARSLFDELGRTKGTDFAAACRRYTDIVSQSILEDRRCLEALDCDPVTLGQFYEWERETDALARQHGHNLRRLEMKYTIPHCI